MENNNEEILINQEETFSLRDFLYRCLSKWWWFAISLLICLLIGAYKIITTIPVYHSSAEVQIKSDSKGRSYDASNEFSNMGMFMTRTNVNNELYAFQSPDLMTEVVERLKLDMDYKIEGKRHDYILYGTGLPINAELLSIDDVSTAGFTVEFLKGDQIRLKDFVLNGERIRDKSFVGTLGDTLATTAGQVVVTKTPYYPTTGKYERDIFVRKNTKKGATGVYGGRLIVSLSDKDADVINLSINDVSTQRGQDVLSTLIGVYNEKWVLDKNQVATATSIFIDDRLKVIEGELAGVDSDISAYKSANMIPDVNAAAEMYMSQSAAINQQMQNLGNQLYMARYVKNSIVNEGSKNQPLPANMGIANTAIESRIAEYNNKLIERNNLVDNSGENNVLVKDYDKALATMRGSISQAIDNEILNLNTQYGNLQGQSRMTAARIAANPNQAKQLLSVERQQGVKQSLYLYLLQKREENELSQAFTAYNTRIIKHPVSNGPVAPQSRNILLIALLFGLFIPLAILYIMVVSDTKVRSKKDVKNLSLPFLGEIPLASKKKGLFKRIKRMAVADNTVVVKPGSRNVVNEAFRVMRTNLEFMTKDKEANVLGITSFNPGSGKSFLSLNLGVCLTVKEKKVLLIDGDLRHGSLSACINNPEKGLSDFLAKKVDSVESIIYHSDDYKTLDVMPIGTIPPNPAELIADPRFGEAVNALKGRYDFVIIDCPPIDIVTDAKIINEFVDRTVFVLRSGIMDKALLPEIVKLYQNGEYKNICYVLNGTSTGSGYYGRYGYYGHYGHYGYYGHKSSYYGSEA